jgi:hypothetical protein
MYFFYGTNQTITNSTPIGQWDLSGYSQVAVHILIKGPGGAKVYPELYFNNLSAAQETLTIGPPGPAGWNIATLAKVYPIFAPTFSLVLYNPSAQMEINLRLYAACCGTAGKTSKSAQNKKVLKKAVKMSALIRAAP